MRFATIFASVLSLGYLAAAAPTSVEVAARSNELAQRSTDVAARDAQCLTGTCPGSGSSGSSGDLLSIIANIQVDINVAVTAITDACNQPGGVTVDILAPLIADLNVKINVLVDAIVNANISVLGLVNINISALASVVASILLNIVLSLQVALNACVDAKGLITASVNIIADLLVKLNGCSPGISVVIGGLIKGHADACSAIGLDLSLLGLNVAVSL